MFAYHFCILFSIRVYELAACLCIYEGVFSLLFCEPVACASAFLVCFVRVIRLRFVYRVCVCPMRFFLFANVLRAFLYVPCVFCVCLA